MIRRVLVIRLGALGDFVLSFGPFAAIRRAHPDAAITLLTTAPFAELGALSPYFDRVEIDRRPRWWQPVATMRLRRQLRGFDFVYDLQTSSRSSLYHLLAGRPRWSGIAPLASHPDRDPDRNFRHSIDRQRGQLRDAGIGAVPLADLSWLRAAGQARLGAELGSETVLPADAYAVLIPGASAHRNVKRWPSGGYVEVAKMLVARGLVPVVVGTEAERGLAQAIVGATPGAVDLTGRTSLPGLAALVAGARLAVGNDTGPMHLAAQMGTRCLTLFSSASDPALSAPVGPDPARLAVLREAVLADLPVGRVCAEVARLLDHAA
ncbi:ADP-heptose:LPS heptosyltransferase [Endobacter medicaginis]|uniref:ADP-heptose:LPS heptosyltransferase n=2 Tax=Endobacter medicaginis TaxID=1181271 RepID=A0A839V482_9PROT|nr:ADP-heptose:LPS heptosyltransferase [Endobacter medicaginis]